jgi:predicted phage terminase large subunit-like protein
MNFNDLSRSELLVVRAQCDESLLYFTRFWYRVLRGTKFIVNWHHDQMCESIEQILRYELELLNINIPPRFSKTELAAVNMIARGIGMNPASNWLYITASDELRAQTSVSIREIVSHPYFKTMYGVELKKDQNSKNLWRTTQGGGLKTATIFGQVTGFGAGQMIEHADVEAYIRQFEGCIILDDVNKTDDAEQENAANDKVGRTIFNTILSRKNSADTPLINIQQRSGMQDATQQLLDHYGADNPKAKFLIYPVLYNGAPLWEWKHDMEAIEQLRTSPKTAHVFETQYMQNPSPIEGLVFPKSDLKRFRRSDVDLTTEETSVSFVDTADKGTDHLAAPFAKIKGQKVYVHDVVFTPLETKFNIPMVVAKANEHRPEFMQVESNFGGTMYIQLMQTLPDLHMNGRTALIPMLGTGNKQTRIVAASALVKNYFYFLDESEYAAGSEYDLFMKALTSYTLEAKHDDAPDATAGMAKMILMYFPNIFDYVIPEDPSPETMHA